MLRRLVLAVVVLVAAWVVVCLVFFTWSPWQSSPPAHADAVVVLSGARNRLPRALTLIRNGVAPILAVSSVSRSKHFALAERLCTAHRYAHATVLCFDAEPYSTRGEAETVARLARRRHWTRVVVVTSRFHITRAHLLFRRCYDGGLWMIGASTPWWRLPVDWADETAKIVYQLTAQRSC